MGETSTDQLLEIHLHHWAKSYFKGTCKCDVVNNNMAEAFNAWILDARCKPIITMLEEIRVMLVKNATTSTKCMLAWNGDGGCEVIYENNQHTVYLKELKCTCKEWELTRIPRCHVVCAMYHDWKNPEAYVSP
ncbi:hypothetical protein CXB51_015227 [Gossypium anomalum]|uniref:Zinc finger PMZ-type domain-containing protein n=1 Tax=Gossypium anomalum TaxID=47600 RepID=A0A8J5YYW2_9ROSI|nr:hypothetical protein CXB51_015227 [Gossypium anomalum]